ncbi:sodium ABC transporter [bacterium]|nr:ATP-binding cassette domain-containing protein [Chloroflexi bacterium CFX6]RIL08597.1 MAG: sodium ABC transporter [bacterium]
MPPASGAAVPADPVVRLDHVVKAFGPARAVDDVTFAVGPGEIFGLLGPNGAGKTTTIRLILDLYRPDSGTIAVLGGAMDDAARDRIGYMPEERGLYRDVTVERCLTYLGTLKGLSPAESRRRVLEHLEQLGLAEHRHKKVKDLSKGMQQKAQLVATLVHRPALVIVDEPFSGLDPVNAQTVKEWLRALSRQGTTIIMSSHQMQTVSELCDRILLINRGRGVLYGPVADIRRRFGRAAVRLRLAGDLPPTPCIAAAEREHGTWTLTLAPGATPDRLLGELAALDAGIEYFEVALPTLEDIFIGVVGGEAPE